MSSYVYIYSIIVSERMNKRHLCVLMHLPCILLSVFMQENRGKMFLCSPSVRSILVNMISLKGPKGIPLNFPRNVCLE